MPQSTLSSVDPRVVAYTEVPLGNVIFARWSGFPVTCPAVRMMPDCVTMTPVPDAPLTLMLTTAGLTL